MPDAVHVTPDIVATGFGAIYLPSMSTAVIADIHLGYARAARLLDLMEDRGIIGPGEGAKPREVYLTDEDGTEQF